MGLTVREAYLERDQELDNAKDLVIRTLMSDGLPYNVQTPSGFGMLRDGYHRHGRGRGDDDDDGDAC